VYDEALISKEELAAAEAKSVLGYQDIHLLGLPDERLDGVLQEIIIPLEKLYNQVKPDIVFINHRGDNNQDHRAVFNAAMVVCRPYASVQLKSLYSYEVPSSTDQAPPLPENAFLPNLYVNISDHMDRKLCALKCYQKELRSFPHPRSIEGVSTYAKKRGSEVGMAAAEAFVVLRDLWR
jgi:LmbE family N-acetylglucosaminyl deacetylase